MSSSPTVAALLERLTPDQRAAATAPPGPVLCIAPAGSGKTTTLVARIAWLIDAVGATPQEITAITFNRRAAEELRTRLDPVLAPLGVAAGTVRVRTFHAIGLEILRSVGRAIELADRMTVLRAMRPAASTGELRAMDDAISRLKLEHRVSAKDVAADPVAGPLARAFVDYDSTLRRDGRLDFDDLVAETLVVLEDDATLLARWRRACRHLLVDEVQDVDRSQLDLAIVLAAPDHRLFLVGDDDQSIYGWRLADVRRVLGLAPRLPGLRRHDLVTNFRCPGPVVARAVRLVEHNLERFPKAIGAREGAVGRVILAPDDAVDAVRWARVLDSWPLDAGSQAILTRTNRELIAAVAAAVDLGRPFRAPRLHLPLESAHLDAALAALAKTDERLPPLRRLAALRADEGPGETADLPPRTTAQEPTDDPDDEPSMSELIQALLAWAPPFPTLETFVTAVLEARARLRSLRRDDAPLTLSTAHATKGLEFDHVAVLMDAERFPSARSLEDAADPARALEEERRLAYVAWTRARRSLTLLYDPAQPSRFLLEAFSVDELGLAA